MKIDQTILQEIEFGTDRADVYYCLVDQKVSSAGLSVDKMRLTDPRNIDLQFRQAGCLMMMTGDEVDELIRRGDLQKSDLHQSLFELALHEGIIKK